MTPTTPPVIAPTTRPIPVPFKVAAMIRVRRVRVFTSSGASSNALVRLT
jgi:hypothetical protein